LLTTILCQLLNGKGQPDPNRTIDVFGMTKERRVNLYDIIGIEVSEDERKILVVSAYSVGIVCVRSGSVLHVLPGPGAAPPGRYAPVYTVLGAWFCGRGVLLVVNLGATACTKFYQFI
jgi:hypothetical protein